MLPGNERARVSPVDKEEKEMRIVFGWAEASWLSVSLAFSYEVPLCSGCPRPRGSFLSSFPPFHLFLIPPFPLSPFLLSFSSLLDSSFPCLAYVPVSSRDLDLGTQPGLSCPVCHALSNCSINRRKRSTIRAITLRKFRTISKKCNYRSKI